MRRAGRPKGTTREVMEIRRHLEREEQNESEAEQNCEKVRKNKG